ncbi:MAG: GGDEF domain-containing protein [Lachnospiraceae bacterium]|nr:GGDEF domain-containing protein [Lachnospiraceae bacterium]
MMHRTKIFYIAAMLCSAFVLYLFCAFYFKSAYNEYDTTFYGLDSGWSYQDGDDMVFTDSLPSNLSTDDTFCATVSAILPGKILDSDILQFHTGHCNVWVYVDDVLIYENTAERFPISKTNGSVCNFVPLDSDMAGKSFSITYQSCYSKDSIQTYPVFFGNERDILYHLIISKLPAFIICTLTFAIGLIGLLCYVVFRKQLGSSSVSLFWLSLFAIAFSSWSGFETQLLVILFPYHLAFSWFTFVYLKLIPIPIIVFMGYTYHVEQSRWLKLLISLSCFDIVVNSALQYLGILDFKETLIFTHLIFLLTIVWIFVLFVSGLRKMKEQRANKENSEQAKPRFFSLSQLYIFFIPTLAVTVMLDFISYYFVASEDSSRFSRITLIAYIIGLTIMLVQNSLESQKLKEKEDSLREMAATDPLTKLKNRASFEKDVAVLPDNELSSYGIAMFDLNKLKYFNDVHGHSMGDYYIIICSEILQDIFCPFGNVYRIGGDEFCAVIKDISPEKYAQLSPMIASRLGALHQTMFEYRMEVADGYAAFDSKLDKSLLHTMERADKQMYTKKQAMKAAEKKKA